MPGHIRTLATLACLVLVFLATPVQPARADAPFVDAGAGLPGMVDVAAAWGDYDNDGALDILISGRVDNGQYVTIIYRNNNGSFVDAHAGLPGCVHGDVAWGDYDNDGDLDILIAGQCDTIATRIYRNDNGVFTNTGIFLPALHFAAVAWGDYDNDGDLDILIAGYTTSWTTTTRIYRNDNGSFINTYITLPGIESGDVDWGDYNNDGRLDIAITGDTFMTSVILRNDGFVFTDIAAGLMPVRHSSIAWGDYDNDGQIDLLLTGDGYGVHSAIYHNDGAAFTLVPAGLTDVSLGKGIWGDYDNDGDLDVLITGAPDGESMQTIVARLYRNDGNNVFTNTDAHLPGQTLGSAAWGDYDNDGDLDLLLSGFNRDLGNFTRIYRNTTAARNTRPNPPTFLSAGVVSSSVLLAWQPAIDSETPSNGLGYNLRVGTTPAGADIVSPMAGAGGVRRLPQIGNAGMGITATLNLNPGVYYWSVQAIDTSFVGGPFADGGTFTIAPPADWGTPTATPTATPVRDRVIFLPVIIKNNPPPTATPTVTQTPTVPPSGWRTITSQDFEWDWPGTWTVRKADGSVYQDFFWGKRNCRAYEGVFSGWAVGGGADGNQTGCGANYRDWSSSWMIYGPFSLADANAAELRFKLWLNTESGSDGLCYLASTDGSNFSGYCASGTSPGWVDRVFDLRAASSLGNLTGQPNVWIALVFVSDGSTNMAEGAHVDNILLRRCVTSYCPGATTILSDADKIELQPAVMQIP